MPNLLVKLLDNRAKMPAKAHPSDSGLDLCSLEPIILFPNTPTVVKTGVAFGIPEGFEIQVRGRSGLASKGIIINNGIGTVDQAYRGEIMVILNNIGRELFRLPAGAKVAQAVLMALPEVTLIPTQEFIDTTDRDTKGFGSSGV